MPGQGRRAVSARPDPGAQRPDPASRAGQSRQELGARAARAPDLGREPADVQDVERRQPGLRYLKIEKSISFWVMNSSSAGWPSRVARIPRRMAGTISPGVVTRSP